uniref:Gag-Pol polyprotein n=1 Tax=Monodelphis domestica TaxID=13616 RepID=A0A5F8HBR7_MONDO
MSVLNPTAFPSPLPRSDQKVSIVGITNHVQSVYLSQPLPFILGEVKDMHSFLLSSDAPLHLLGRDFLDKYKATIEFSPGKEIRLSLSPSDAPPTFQILTAPIIAYDLPQLEEVPSSLWATDSSDIGRILSAPPIQVQLDPSKPLPRVPQYPLSREATEGIRPLIDSYLEAGILIKCSSPCNSPILGVRKPGGRGWRLGQDLRAVNACVIPRAPVVSNPHNLLNQIPHSAKIFTVVDLCSAYFSVPLHADSQFLFAFTWEGIQLCWTVLPQGYTESATYFSQVLKADLAGLKFPFGSTLLQYVDDLLLCSPDAQSSREDSIVLLKSLAQKGHKVSKEKMQFVSSQVKFLGHLISAEGCSLDPARVAAILNFPRPQTKRQLRGFMGLAGYCRLWVPSFSLVAKPLFDLLKASSPEPLIWNEAAKIAFMNLKSALSNSPALGRPNYSLPFHLFLLERNGISLGVLSQKHGDHFRPLGYYSKSLDSVARGLPSCLRAVVAASDLLELVEEVTLESPLTLHVPHAIEVLLNSHHTQHFSTSRLAKLEASLLAKSNITISRCKTLNPATFLPDIEESDRDCTEGHDYVNIVDSVLSPREDLQEKELENPDFSWYTDGSCLRNESGILVAGYAITTTAEVIEAGHLPSAISAQQAELEAVTRACELAKGKRVNIYTDSRYAFGVAHDFGMLWQHRGYQTSSGTPIKNGAQVRRLLEALLLPKVIAIIKISGHSRENSPHAKGNALADQYAKEAARQLPTTIGLTLSDKEEPIFENKLTQAEIVSAQEVMSRTIREKLEKEGCVRNRDTGLWQGPNGCVVLPDPLCRPMMEYLHSISHWGPDKLVSIARKYWWGRLRRAAEDVYLQCQICPKYNISKPLKPMPGKFPLPEAPFQVWQIDFIQLPPHAGYKFVLVMVCMFSRWVEAFPCRQATATAVAKCLLEKIFPVWGIPREIHSDRGTHFTGSVVSQLLTAWPVLHHLHCAYHPQSSGLVERVNGIIKVQLAKFTEDLNIPWPKALPIVLLNLRATPFGKLSLSPFEIITGRPMSLFPPYTDSMSTKVSLLSYCQGLRNSSSETPSTSKVKPGDWVYRKRHLRKDALQVRWDGPHQVLLVNPSAAKLKGIESWIHLSHLKKAPTPKWSVKSMSDSKIRLTRRRR